MRYQLYDLYGFRPLGPCACGDGDDDGGGDDGGDDDGDDCDCSLAVGRQLLASCASVRPRVVYDDGVGAVVAPSSLSPLHHSSSCSCVHLSHLIDFHSDDCFHFRRLVCSWQLVPMLSSLLAYYY